MEACSIASTDGGTERSTGCNAPHDAGRRFANTVSSGGVTKPTQKYAHVRGRGISDGAGQGRRHGSCRRRRDAYFLDDPVSVLSSFTAQSRSTERGAGASVFSQGEKPLVWFTRHTARTPNKSTLVLEYHLQSVPHTAENYGATSASHPVPFRLRLRRDLARYALLPQLQAQGGVSRPAVQEATTNCGQPTTGRGG